jgi:hypothetical protein
MDVATLASFCRVSLSSLSTFCRVALTSASSEYNFDIFVAWSVSDEIIPFVFVRTSSISFCALSSSIYSFFSLSSIFSTSSFVASSVTSAMKSANQWRFTLTSGVSFVAWSDEVGYDGWALIVTWPVLLVPMMFSISCSGLDGVCG